MKRVWCRPQTVVQKFEANEYVAACGDSGNKVYKFTCAMPAAAYTAVVTRRLTGIPRPSDRTEG